MVASQSRRLKFVLLWPVHLEADSLKVIGARCLLHEQLFAQLQANIQTNHQSLEARLDKLDQEMIILTAPVKIVKFLFRIAGWQFP